MQDKPKLQTMVAVLIYAGLRREELLWLTLDDIDLKTGPYGMIRIRAKRAMFTVLSAARCLANKL